MGSRLSCRQASPAAPIMRMRRVDSDTSPIQIPWRIEDEKKVALNISGGKSSVKSLSGKKTSLEHAMKGERERERSTLVSI